jgi:hypothetical protein
MSNKDIKTCPPCNKDTGRSGFVIRYGNGGRIRVHRKCARRFDRNRDAFA